MCQAQCHAETTTFAKNLRTDSQAKSNVGPFAISVLSGEPQELESASKKLKQLCGLVAFKRRAFLQALDSSRLQVSVRTSRLPVKCRDDG